MINFQSLSESTDLELTDTLRYKKDQPYLPYFNVEGPDWDRFSAALLYGLGKNPAYPKASVRNIGTVFIHKMYSI